MKIQVYNFLLEWMMVKGKTDWNTKEENSIWKLNLILLKSVIQQSMKLQNNMK